MVQWGFYVWTFISFLLIFLILHYSKQRKRYFRGYLLFFALWLTYIMALQQSTVLEDFNLPPRIPLLVVVPAIVCILILTGQKKFREVVESTPLYVPVYLQSFRIIVEVLIYGAYLNGIFPKRATFEGMNFDVLVGLSALIIGYLVQRKKLNHKGLFIWNIVSLMVLSVTVYSFISTYYYTDYSNTVGHMDFVQVPYLFLASVLLPIALFLHVFSLRQIKMISHHRDA